MNVGVPLMSMYASTILNLEETKSLNSEKEIVGFDPFLFNIELLELNKSFHRELQQSCHWHHLNFY